MPATGSTDDGAISIGLADGRDDVDDPRSRFYVIDVAEPGEQVRRTVRVGNRTAEDRRIDVYESDATVGDGDFHLADDAADVTAWSSIEPATLDIPAGGSATATVSIAVPADADDGERYGVIWAQPQGSDVQGVVNRVSVRVYLLVDRDGSSTTELIVDTLRPRRDDDGRAQVVVTLSNTGDRATEVTGELTLDGDEHRGALAPPLTLAPGETRQAGVALDGNVADGPWEARLTLDVNGVERVAAATIELPDGAGETGEQVAATMVQPSSSPPVALVALAAALPAIVVVASARARSRRGTS